MSNLTDLALEEAALKTLADAVLDRLKVVKATMQEALLADGISKVEAKLPDGTKVATISRSDAKPAAVVTDDDAFLGWVRENSAHNITSKVVTEVRPAYRAALLAEMTAAGVAEWVDKDTGVIHDIPGVEVKATRSLTHSVRPVAGGKEAIAQAYRMGLLNHLDLLQITAGGEAPPAAPLINLEHQHKDARGAIWEWTGDVTPHGDPIMESPGWTPPSRIDLLKLIAQDGPLTDTGSKRAGGVE